MAKIYLVFVEDAEEGVAFSDYADAVYAATGDPGEGFGVSTLADEFRNCYGENGELFEIKTIEI